MKRLNIINLQEMGVIFNACDVFDNKDDYTILFEEKSKFLRAWQLYVVDVKRIEFIIGKDIDYDIIEVDQMYFDADLNLMQHDDAKVTANNFKEDISELIFKRIKRIKTM